MTVLLNGALNEAALWLADADAPSEALDRADRAFAHLTAALKPDAAAARRLPRPTTADRGDVRGPAKMPPGNGR